MHWGLARKMIAAHNLFIEVKLLGLRLRQPLSRWHYQKQLSGAPPIQKNQWPKDSSVLDFAAD